MLVIMQTGDIFGRRKCPKNFGLKIHPLNESVHRFLNVTDFPPAVERIKLSGAPRNGGGRAPRATTRGVDATGPPGDALNV